MTGHIARHRGLKYGMLGLGAGRIPPHPQKLPQAVLPRTAGFDKPAAGKTDDGASSDVGGKEGKGFMAI